MSESPLSGLEVLFVSSEIAPFAKTGGLADVCASLPAALCRLGCKPTLVMPYYFDIVNNSLVTHRKNGGEHIRLEDTGRRLGVAVGDSRETLEVWRSELAGCAVYLLRNDPRYRRPDLYMERGWDYGDNNLRFDLLCRGAAALCDEMGIRPAIVHCHDWQSALLPAYVKTGALGAGNLAGAKTILTIHNLGPKGDFHRGYFGYTGLPDWLNHDINGAEYWGSWSFLKAGLLTADALTTVSPAYAYEIQTRSCGQGLEDLLYRRRDDLTGILNGSDYEVWSPENDAHLPARYSAAEPAGKLVCRDALLKQMNLDPAGPDTLVLGFVGRLSPQKGVGHLIWCADGLLNAGLDVRVCILGKGDQALVDSTQYLRDRFPGRAGVYFGFDEPLAHRIYAGSDLFFMPSEFEPCGLAQMYALAYGTPVITRPVGGLKATVRQYDPRSKTGTGFLFAQYDLDGILSATWEALEVLADPEHRAAIVANCMAERFPWEQSAREYAELYLKLLA